ncbi:hypothetical protein FB567DRAFT_132878 [Paraphoma chrysanthemicola]|uniref:Inner kinetochore subunit AME1 domain-containing protein n=1 Tax=Paraphoma chrysanthemicola TaxID=798071 RepID=A0A8K0QYV6_9PLEO|nr:hypothetical protein FB567DRAFT_132878 [Paraphoma chrysanthemicola]
MAPVDRREHRQQRVRGAGPSSVQASFGFNFGALAARPSKQASLPPQRSSRRTPVRSTPNGANGSARRHRSASAPRSSATKRQRTPKDQTVTPQLGKRKRGSPNAEPVVDDGGEDELTPNHEDFVRSIEKSRRVVGTVSPIREEADDVPDELSVLDDVGSTARKTAPRTSAVLNGTPVSVLAQKRVSPGTVPARTPIADRIGGMTVTSRQSTSRRSKSSELAQATPSMLPNGRPRTSPTSHLGPQFDTPGARSGGDESEDELSPPKTNGTTARVVGTEDQSITEFQESADLEEDELSSPMQPTPVQETPLATKTQQAPKPRPTVKKGSAVEKPLAKAGRPRKIVLDEEEDEPSSTTIPKPVAKRGRPPKSKPLEDAPATATPATRKPRNKKNRTSEVEMEDDEVDELSPDKDRNTGGPKQAVFRREREVVEVSDREESDFEEPEPEEEPEPTPIPTTKRPSPKRKQPPKPSIEQPPRKRHKFLGPKHAISVMRIKGSTVRGITAADTTRTILGETIEHRLSRMAEKMQTSKDSARRKELRSEINLSLSFQESLNEKLLDLQDANDILSSNFKKMKLFKRDNAELRKEILALQNSRQEIALEHDDAQEAYDAEKALVDARNKLSEDMFDIGAAIQNGRRKARKEGREDEGPEIPLSMLLGMVGRDVGSVGGGLLANVKSFNSALERAAGWLEGRA